jgi:hypothetical protein
MKIQTILVALNEAEPIATKAVVHFEDNSEIVVYAKASKLAIMHQLKGAHCTDLEITVYTPKIKSMLSQFDEASDFPVPPIA